MPGIGLNSPAFWQPHQAVFPWTKAESGRKLLSWAEAPGALRFWGESLRLSVIVARVPPRLWGSVLGGFHRAGPGHSWGIGLLA